MSVNEARMQTCFYFYLNGQLDGPLSDVTSADSSIMCFPSYEVALTLRGLDSYPTPAFPAEPHELRHGPVNLFAKNRSRASCF
jgi:hypothetical protein